MIIIHRYERRLSNSVGWAPRVSLPIDHNNQKEKEDVADRPAERQRAPVRLIDWPETPIMWTNVMVCTAFHAGAVYGLYLSTGAKWQTNLWGGYRTEPNRYMTTAFD